MGFPQRSDAGSRRIPLSPALIDDAGRSLEVTEVRREFTDESRRDAGVKRVLDGELFPEQRFRREDGIGRQVAATEEQAVASDETVVADRDRR